MHTLLHNEIATFPGSYTLPRSCDTMRKKGEHPLGRKEARLFPYIRDPHMSIHPRRLLFQQRPQLRSIHSVQCHMSAAQEVRIIHRRSFTEFPRSQPYPTCCIVVHSENVNTIRESPDPITRSIVRLVAWQEDSQWSLGRIWLFDEPQVGHANRRPPPRPRPPRWSASDH